MFGKLILVITIVISFGVLTGSALSETGKVVSVYDGDTLTVRSGTNILKVRLVQIDTPEIRGGECYGTQARSSLRKLAPVGSTVTLKSEPNTDNKDRYGRVLRYVYVKGKNLNLTMVQRGDAAPYFYNSVRGKFANSLMNAANKAQNLRRGLWKTCPGTVLTPNKALTTAENVITPVIPPTPAPVTPPDSNCSPNYDKCIPSSPDLDCSDIRARGLAPIKVIGTDTHRLDSDGDGWGCE